MFFMLFWSTGEVFDLKQVTVSLGKERFPAWLLNRIVTQKLQIYSGGPNPIKEIYS